MAAPSRFPSLLRFSVLLSLLLFASQGSAAHEKTPRSFDWTQVEEILSSGIADRIYPGAVALVADFSGILFLKAFGSLTYDGDDYNHDYNTLGGVHDGAPGSAPVEGDDNIRKPQASTRLINQPVGPDTVYDLASLTKVLAATTAAMILYQRGHLELDMKLADPTLFGEEYAVNGKAQITVRNLLLHNSGLPAGPSPTYFSKSFGCPETFGTPPGLSFSCRDLLYDAVLAQKASTSPGVTTVYSDLSMITLMYVIGLLAGRHGYVLPADLDPACASQSGRGVEQCYYDAFIRKHVLEFLGMTNSAFFIEEDERANIPPTWFDSAYRNFTMQGVVSDGNAYAMGGISGNAGLFSNVADIHKLIKRLIFATPTDDWINKETVSLFTTVFNATLSTRALGWDTNSALGSTCGSSFSRETFLHTGYTGTQVCADPVEEPQGAATSPGLITILLTNRCHPNDSSESSSGISTIRRSFNTAVKEAYRNGGK